MALVLSWGSEAHAAAHLSLKEVAQKVLLTNPEVLSKWHAFRASEGDVDVARAGFYPRIDYTTGVGRETLRQPGVADREYTRNGYTLTLNQMLYDGFATSSDVKRLDKGRLTRYFELIDAAENAALETGRVYYDVMRYRLLMFLAEQNYIEHRASYEQLLRRLQAGAGRRVDVEHAAGRLALAELNLNTEAANLHDVMARYLRLVGDRPPPVLFGPGRLGVGYPASESEALKLGLRHNPALRAAVENVESAQHDLDVRRGAFHPKLDLRLRSENSGNYQGVTGTRQNNVAELVLSYNLFNGGADTARQRVYAERKGLAQDLRDKSCRDTRQTLSIAYNDVLRLRAQLSNLSLQVSAIEKTRDAYKAQFNIGQRSLLDLLDTENELLNARRTAVNSDMDLAIAYLRTHAGIGRLMEFLGIRTRGMDDDIDLASEAESEICPSEVPSNYLVDLGALTARALAQLDPPKPLVPTKPAAPLPPPNPPASAPLSYPPPMPAPRSKGPPSAASWAMPTPAKPSPAKPSPALPPLVSNPLPDPATKPSGAAAQPLSQGKVFTERVMAWAAAWSSKSYAAYMGFYSPSFVPADGSSRARWEKQRAARLAISDLITVEINNFRLNEMANDVFVAEFDQHYSSARYSDRTHKVLRWVRVDGQWLIEREIVKPLPGVGGGRKKEGR